MKKAVWEKLKMENKFKRQPDILIFNLYYSYACQDCMHIFNAGDEVECEIMEVNEEDYIIVIDYDEISVPHGKATAYYNGPKKSLVFFKTDEENRVITDDFGNPIKPFDKDE